MKSKSRSQLTQVQGESNTNWEFTRGVVQKRKAEEDTRIFAVFLKPELGSFCFVIFL